MKLSNIFNSQYFWLILILLISFVVRLYKIDSPIADWHSWRQADTAAVTRNFIKEGFNPLIPKFDDMSGISENPIVNTNRFRFVEFPIYNIAVYPLYLFFGINDLYSRLVSVIFSLGSIIFLYLICKRYLGSIVSMLVMAVYGLLPFNIFFSRTILPEPTFLFFTLGMMYFVDKRIWEEKSPVDSSSKGSWGVWGFIFTTLAFLIKPWAIFFVPPLIYSLLKKEGNFKKSIKYLGWFTLALLPFVLWRLWILQQPQGIPASNWLMNGDHIRFRPAFWWWLVSERLGREILGATGLVLFVIGLLVRPRNSNYFMHIWVVSLFSYFVIFATGNVRHNYYQYIFGPVAAVFLTQGFVSLIKGLPNFLPRFWTIILAMLFLPLSFYFSFLSVKEFYKINNPNMIEAGKKADQILPKNAVIVAPYNGDSAFLYQTNRSGFPFVPLPSVELVADFGVTHFVSTNHDSKTNWVLRHFLILEDNPKFVISDLTKIVTPLSPKDPEP